MTDPYSALGVPRDASDAEIRKAFRALARVHHPDREGGDHEKMSEANRAYELLTDPERRARYDATGATEEPKPVDAWARDTLFRILLGVMANQPEEANLADAVRSALQHANRQVQTGLMNLRTESRRLDRRRANLKDDGLFAGLFEQRAREISDQIRNGEGELEVLTRAAEMMAGVSWDGPGQTAQIFTASTGSATIGFR